MKRSFTLLLAITAIALISGCAGGPKPLYNYDDYSDSYYGYKKAPTEASALSYQKAVEQSIANAKDSRSGRVAPGMYANLGYIDLKSGKNKEAIDNFIKEKTIYPESAHFMDRMIKKVQTMQGDKK